MSHSYRIPLHEHSTVCRSLWCLGINEQVLHLWIEIFCCCADVIVKWYFTCKYKCTCVREQFFSNLTHFVRYHPWSILNSPGWVGLKCNCKNIAIINIMQNDCLKLFFLFTRLFENLVPVFIHAKSKLGTKADERRQIRCEKW